MYEKDGTLRSGIDYLKFNLATVRDCYRLTRTAETMDSLNEAQVVFKLNRDMDLGKSGLLKQTETLQLSFLAMDCINR